MERGQAPVMEREHGTAEDFTGGAWRSLCPFQSRHLCLDRETASLMHYVDEGEGEPILMVHGNPTWSFFYRRMITALRWRYRCVAPDHMGCGLSSKPQVYPYCLKQHIDNLDKLVTELDLRDMTLVVHDWGGPIGLGMALRHPERIKRIVVLNTAAFPSKRIPLRINLCRLPGVGPVIVRFFNGFARAAIRMAVAKRDKMTPNTVKGFLAPYDSWENRVALHRFIQDIPMRPGHPSYPLLEEIGRKLSVFKDRPVLICWGERDFCFNTSFLQRWKEIYPHAEVHSFPDAGHYLLEDAHERIIPLVKKFLEQG